MFKILAVTILFSSVTLGDWIVPDSADEYTLVPLLRPVRLWNGTYATIEEFPYQVLVYESHGNNIWHPVCSGAIISSYWILTAAHCVDDARAAYSIRAGSAHRLNGGTHHKADITIPHADWLKRPITEIANDIALVHVETPFEFDITRQPVPLYDPDEEIKDNIDLVISGWGDVNESDSPSPEILQLITLPVIAKDQCKDRFKDKPFLNLDKCICAGYKDGRQVTCPGDSGDPVTVNGRLAGLVSLNQDGCVNSTIPVVITEVAKYRHWIRSISGI